MFVQQKKPDGKKTRWWCVLMARWAPAQACEQTLLSDVTLRSSLRLIFVEQLRLLAHACVGLPLAQNAAVSRFPLAPLPAERPAHRLCRWKQLWSGLFWDLLIWLKIFFADVGYSLIKVLFLFIVKWKKKTKFLPLFFDTYNLVRLWAGNSLKVKSFWIFFPKAWELCCLWWVCTNVV